VDLDPYIFFQISRDTASRAEGPLGYPLIYADNTAMLGGGVQFRFWRKQAGLFAQVGSAFGLLPLDEQPVAELDFRAGAFLAVEAPACRPEPGTGEVPARAELKACGDIYSEAIYVSRFDHNLLVAVRGRVGFTYLVTGPVSWAPLLEGRLLKDVLGDYWNNLADGGIAHRWRLLKPFGLDLLVGLHGGGYFGLQRQDPPPDPLSYLDFRVQLATYASF